jgi:hypothetical protein
MDDDTSLGADLAAAMSDTSTQDAAAESSSTVDASAPTGTATTQPAEETTAPVTTEPTNQGPIPFAVHHTALANARTKAVEEAQAKWDQEYGWAKNPLYAEGAKRIAAHQGNPIGLLSEITDSLAQTPEGAQLLRSFLGQKFGGLRQRAEAPHGPTMPEPDVVIRDDQGNVVGQTYSAQAQAQREAVLEQQWLQKVAETFGPRLQTLDTIAQERAHEAATVQAESFASSFLGELQALPGFDLTKHGPAIAAELKQVRLRPDAHPSEVNAAAYRAYTKIVLPELNSLNRRDIVTTQQQKAGVNTASPSTGSTGTPKSYQDMTWSEAFQHEMAARR